MLLLPALISRPLLDAPAGPADPAEGAGAPQAVQLDLVSGLPAQIGLDATRSLVLSVPLGVAGGVIGADPLAVAFDTAAPGDPGTLRDGGAAWPRLTLVAAGALGETVPAVAGVPFRIRMAATAVLELTLQQLMITAGSLRGPGRFGSRIVLLWRDLFPAPDTGPPPSAGDIGIPRLLTGG